MSAFKHYFRLILVFLLPLIFKAQNSINFNLPEKIQAYSVHTLEISIKKGTVSSFSKYQLDVPEGIVIKEGVSNDGNFSFDGKRAKYVWVECPKTDEFKISFIMLAGDVKEKGIFEHKFYYIDGEVKKEISGPSKEVEFIAGVMNDAYKRAFDISHSNKNLKEQNQNISNNTPTISPSSDQNSTVKSLPAKTSVSVAMSGTVNLSNSSSTVSSTSSPNSSNTTPVSLSENKEYRVQIGSFSSKPSFSKFSNLGKLSVIEENGVYKLMVGSYYSKEEAVKKMDELKTKGYSGFIVSFVNGVKVK